MPARRDSAPARETAPPHAVAGRRGARRSSNGPASTASTRTSTTSSGSSFAQTTPRPTTTRRSWVPARSSCPDLLAAIRPPRDEGPRGRRAADPDRGRAARARRVRRARRRHDLATPGSSSSSRRASRRAGRSAGWPDGCGVPLGATLRSATSGTTSRCSRRSGTGRRCRPRRPKCAPPPATSPRRSRTMARRG